MIDKHGSHIPSPGWLPPGAQLNLTLIRRTSFHFKLQGLMTRGIEIDEEEHAIPNLKIYLSS